MIKINNSNYYFYSCITLLIILVYDGCDKIENIYFLNSYPISLFPPLLWVSLFFILSTRVVGLVQVYFFFYLIHKSLGSDWLT